VRAQGIIPEYASLALPMALHAASQLGDVAMAHAAADGFAALP